MKIESLQVFRDLAETRSFTRTAQVNGVTQSAVSQQISALERLFKSPLVQRGKRRFCLTPKGSLLYEHSQEILQTFGALQNTLEKSRGVISGTIRVASIYSIGLHDLAPYQKEFLKRYPAANLHIEYRRAEQVYEDVLGNVVDLGLVAFPARHRELQTILLREEPLVVICHPQNPLAKRKTIPVKALDGQKFISFERNVPTRRALDQIFKANRITVKHVLEFDNIEIVKQAVEIDSGIAIVPQSTVRVELANRTLAMVRLEGDFTRPQAVIYTKSKVLSPAMKQFVALLKEPL
jgi:LysR family transcriptional regulator, transcriptional activator of the cysJI operon